MPTTTNSSEHNNDEEKQQQQELEEDDEYKETNSDKLPLQSSICAWLTCDHASSSQSERRPRAELVRFQDSRGK
ncbi:MAG: hypothetical protein ACREBS_02250 [Nitrososphaerales archaeon]